MTAFGVEPLTEQHVPATPEASAPLKAAVKGLWGLAIRNQGLSDKRERSEVVQALTYLSRPAKRSPSSPTSASTRCSTAGRSRPASPPATARACWSTRTWGWSPRSSTSAASARSRATWRSGTAATPPPAPARGRTPSPPSAAATCGTVALAHNGNLTNSAELRDRLEARNGEGFSGHLGGELRRGNTTDTALVTALLTDDPDRSLEAAALDVLPQLRGAFCFVFMDEHTLYAARDPQGIRPLVLGRLERGWVVASETAALDIVGASLVREVEPGELVTIDADGLRTQRFAEADPKGCVFEYVYLARPDTTINGRGVHEARVEMGRQLAREHPVEADLVIPTPESGTPAAIGYAQESGIPYGQGLVKNSYVGRTFIAPSQTIRQLGIRLKLNPLKDVIRGKRLVVVDDSIVRGNTQRALVRMLREAGAAEVHVRISSPPVRWPCFYGIDFATRAELIATGIGVEEVRSSIGADTLGYISEDGHGRLDRAAARPALHGLLQRRLPDRAAAARPARQEPARAAAGRQR